MIIICAWCKEKLGEKEPLGDRRITHGICKGCAENIKTEMKDFLRKVKEVDAEIKELENSFEKRGKR